MIKQLAFAISTMGLVFAASEKAEATTTFAFQNIAGGDDYGDAYAGNFSLDVTDLGAGEVLFQIVSASAPGLSYFIRTIFVDDTDPTSFTDIPLGNDNGYSNGDVSMAYAPGGNLPQGNNVGFSAVFNFEADNGHANTHAIQQGETAGFVFGGDFNNIIAALGTGDLRFGIHVQNLPDVGQVVEPSDSYVTSVPPLTPVPVPAAGVMLLTALGGLGYASRRRRKAA